MSTTSPIFGRTRDGMLVARVGDQVFAMRPHEGGFHLVKAWGLTGTIDDWTVADFHDNRRDPVDEAEFRRTVEEWADHQRQLVLLGRRSIAARASTPWGLSQHAVAYADGVVAHSTASHGGFALCFAWGRPQSLGHADANRMMVELQTAPVEPPRGAFPTRSAGPKLPGGLPSEFGGV
ncbi:hypothetical protein ACDY97_33385 [Rhizobium mongolense]|uniref:DUF7007 domain-containing protein n=1 Tax=Rhizobium mongolense TaxID=57676 RepID=UPI0035570603